ncbi:hypothetical protein ABFS83_05G109600 [Erythranthe nasuta]
MLMAVEIQRLMPSFGKKLDLNGFTPVDLALRRAHALTTAALQEGRGLTPAEVALREALFRTVRALIDVNPELVRVQGREGITPLHFAAETNDVELLDELLMTFPESINVLTIRGETAVHVAVRNRNLEALKVLCGWLARCDRSQVLGWKDREGNTILHVAASTNQPAVLKLLVERTTVRQKNSAGLTALDIVRQLPAHVNGISARSILENRENETTLSGSILPHNDKQSFSEAVFEMSEFTTRGMSGDTRNAFLVVTVLIATAAYQGVLNPPGGFNQGNNIINTNNVANYNTTNTGSFDASGKAVMSKQHFYSFMAYNSGALAASLGLIVFLIPLNSANDFSLAGLLCPCLVNLLIGYVKALKVISPLDVNKNKELQVYIILTFIAIVLFKIVVLYISRRRLPSP